MGKYTEGSFFKNVEDKLSTIAANATSNDSDSNLKNRANHTGSQLASTISDFSSAVDARIANVVGNAPSALDTLVELSAALGDDPNYAATITAALGDLAERLDDLEAWQAKMPKRVDVYTGTTDANGDVTISFPGGRYSMAPVLAVDFIFNNDNYGSLYNVKSNTTSGALLRIMRTKNTSVVLGGSVDPDEPLASTAVKVIAIEF